MKIKTIHSIRQLLKLKKINWQALIHATFLKIKNQKHYYRCETCHKRFKYLNINNCETNLRKNLGKVYKIPNIMFASQQKNLNEKKSIYSATIDEAISNAIIIDGRPFNDLIR